MTAVRKSDRSFIGAFLPDLFIEIYQFFLYLILLRGQKTRALSEERVVRRRSGANPPSSPSPPPFHLEGVPGWTEGHGSFVEPSSLWLGLVIAGVACEVELAHAGTEGDPGRPKQGSVIVRLSHARGT